MRSENKIKSKVVKVLESEKKKTKMKIMEDKQRRRNTFIEGKIKVKERKCITMANQSIEENQNVT